MPARRLRQIFLAWFHETIVFVAKNAVRAHVLPDHSAIIYLLSFEFIRDKIVLWPIEFQIDLFQPASARNRV